VFTASLSSILHPSNNVYYIISAVHLSPIFLLEPCKTFLYAPGGRLVPSQLDDIHQIFHFWWHFFPLPNMRSWLQHEKAKSCQKKVLKVGIQKMDFRVLRIEWDILAFWLKWLKFFFNTVVHAEIEQCENFGYFDQTASMSHSILGTLKSIFCIPTLSTFFGNF